jgi:hypothetical protein
LLTPGIESIRKANLLSRPWVTIAWAMMNAPINRKMTGSIKAPKTMSPGASSAFGPTCGMLRSTHMASARTAVTGIGMASESQ